MERKYGRPRRFPNLARMRERHEAIMAYLKRCPGTQNRAALLREARSIRYRYKRASGGLTLTGE